MNSLPKGIIWNWTKKGRKEAYRSKMGRNMKDIQNAYVENITDVEYSDIMKKSYLDYSMSVIVSRAITRRAEAGAAENHL